MRDLALTLPAPIVMRSAVAAVWLYEGLWNKVFGRAARQAEVVAAVPRLGARFGGPFLRILGLVEAGLAIWVLSGVLPGTCAITQIVLLVVLNINGLLWSRHLIHDPAGMVIKNLAFLVLVWVCGTGVGWHP